MEQQRAGHRKGRVRIHGGGRLSGFEKQIFEPADTDELRAVLAERPSVACIARGGGQSYGDNALAENVVVVGLRHAWELDNDNGLLRVAAGFTLREILREIVPKGWFLPVLPGTALVSVGGAVAADVHGKNHHRDGSFCEHVRGLRLMLADGGIVRCSPVERPELFRATCGGMGLTGIILDVELRLTRIAASSMTGASLPAANLDHCFDLLEENDSAHYSVAWLDCLARGPGLGRGAVFLAEHATEGELRQRDRRTFGVPFTVPGMLLNRHSLSFFNAAYFYCQRFRAGTKRLGYDTYFFPLDRIRNWKPMYVAASFLQYQFVLPAHAAREGISKVLRSVSDAGKGSFLSVLKKMGPANGNLLSFPVSGYTLALDFKREAALFPLLEKLDSIVLDHGGRLYLAKDTRMSEAVFKAGYPDWDRFLAIKQQVDPACRFRSAQSDRVGLTGP